MTIWSVLSAIVFWWKVDKDKLEIIPAISPHRRFVALSSIICHGTQLALRLRKQSGPNNPRTKEESPPQAIPGGDHSRMGTVFQHRIE